MQSRFVFTLDRIHQSVNQHQWVVWFTHATRLLLAFGFLLASGSIIGRQTSLPTHGR